MILGKATLTSLGRAPDLRPSELQRIATVRSEQLYFPQLEVPASSPGPPAKYRHTENIPARPSSLLARP